MKKGKGNRRRWVKKVRGRVERKYVKQKENGWKGR
jgi:hypothetical protein